MKIEHLNAIVKLAEIKLQSTKHPYIYVITHIPRAMAEKTMTFIPPELNPTKARQLIKFEHITFHFLSPNNLVNKLMGHSIGGIIDARDNSQKLISTLPQFSRKDYYFPWYIMQLVTEQGRELLLHLDAFKETHGICGNVKKFTFGSHYGVIYQTTKDFHSFDGDSRYPIFDPEVNCPPDWQYENLELWTGKQLELRVEFANAILETLKTYRN